MYKYLIILICSIFAVGCDQPVAENTDNNPAKDSLTVFTTAKDTDQRLPKLVLINSNHAFNQLRVRLQFL